MTRLPCHYPRPDRYPAAPGQSVKSAFHLFVRAAKKPNHRHRRLLRARRERARSHRAPEQRDELASSQVEHGLLPGTRCASLLQAQDATEAPAGPWDRPESFWIGAASPVYATPRQFSQMLPSCFRPHRRAAAFLGDRRSGGRSVKQTQAPPAKLLSRTWKFFSKTVSVRKATPFLGGRNHFWTGF